FDGVDRFVEANNIIREPWTCLGIETLCCGIFGIVRLTKDEQRICDKLLEVNPTYLENDGISTGLTDTERAVVQKLKRSQEQQRQAYERLASLQHLKHLDLGFGIRRSDAYIHSKFYTEVDGMNPS
ncbi:hypothetical protein BGZ65_001040, partial [Modicella reniformis]